MQNVMFLFLSDINVLTFLLFFLLFREFVRVSRSSDVRVKQSSAVVCVLCWWPSSVSGWICWAVLHTCRAPHRCVPLTCHSPAAFDSSERFLCSLTFLREALRQAFARGQRDSLEISCSSSNASLVLLFLCDV